MFKNTELVTLIYKSDTTDSMKAYLLYEINHRCITVSLCATHRLYLNGYV